MGHIHLCMASSYHHPPLGDPEPGDFATMSTYPAPHHLSVIPGQPIYPTSHPSSQPIYVPTDEHGYVAADPHFPQQHLQQEASQSLALASGYWQMPPAPRMSTAAARGWNAEQPEWNLYPHLSGLHPYSAPWAPTMSHHHVPDHHAFETQMMMQQHPGHRQMASAAPFSMANQPYASTVSATAQQAYPAPPYPQMQQQASDLGNGAWVPSQAAFHQQQQHYGGFAEPRRSNSCLPPSFQYDRPIQTHAQAMQPRTSLGTYHSQADQDWSRGLGHMQQQPQQQRRHRHSQSDWQALQSWQRHQQQICQQHSVPRQSQQHHHPVDSHVSAAPHVDHRGWLAQQDHSGRAGRSRHESVGNLWPGATPRHPGDVQHAEQHSNNPTFAVQPLDEQSREQSSKAQEIKGPAPPSPDTLDKSGVPLSSFGAELIWFACAPLMEPEFVALARADELATSAGGSQSPSSDSASSSPCLSTPQTSPHSPQFGSAKDVEMNLAMLSSASLGERLLRMGERNTCNEKGGIGTPSPEVPYNQKNLASTTQKANEVANTTRWASPSPRGSPRKDRALTRTKSQERTKASVLSALGLVSSQWHWTHAKEVLPSLVEAAEQASSTRAASNPVSPKEGAGSNAALGVAAEVSPAFRRFAHQVLAQTLLSPTAFLLALLYSLRVPYLAVDQNGNVDPEAVEVFASPPSAAPFKLFTLGLMIANKHLDDNTFLNKTWNEVTGIPLAELNRMEQYYLIRCNFEIAVPNLVWCTFLKRVKRREEGKVDAGLHSLRKVSHCGEVSQPREVRSNNVPTHRSDSSTSRRVLLAVEDMLVAMGSEGIIDALDLDNAQPDNSSDSATMTLQSPSHGQSRARPTSTLLLNHKHCQSAPAKLNDVEAAEKSQLERPTRPSFEVNDRSWSDHTVSGYGLGRSLCVRQEQQQQSPHDAPLAPSALLQLLNSGKSLAVAR